MEKKNYKLLFWAFFVALVLVCLFLVFRESILSGSNSTGNGDIGAFVDCLNRKGIFLYGSPEDANVKVQLSSFEDYADRVKVVDCTLNSSACAGVIIFPTWNINEILVHGSLSLNVLSRFSGCNF